jgi:hypothetical protein
MDIEGGEPAALRGMQELSRRSPTLRMVMEYDLGNLERAGATRAELRDALVALGFRTAHVVEQGMKRFPLSGPLPATRATYDLLLTKA